MLEQLHKVVITRQISTDPRFKGVISALRRPATKQFGDVYDLDKKQTSTADLLGVLRLSLLCLRNNYNYNHNWAMEELAPFSVSQASLSSV